MQGASLRLAPDEHTGRTLGKYEVLCRLSLGGMSEIFLAFSRGLAGFRKLVVLKQILPDIKGEEEFVRMFLDEAKITAAFNHPNIAQVFDLDVQNGELFLAMEFVPGATLVEVARACRANNEPIPMGLTLQAVRDTALALHYAHTFTDPLGRLKTVIHRDIAEKNVMVTYEGTTKLLDFGIAKNFGRLGRTQAGMVKGTSGYMSPEQIMGEPLDPRSDIFSLGVVLHECLTGMRLFHGKTAEQGMLAALKGDIQLPSAQNPGVTAALDAVCIRALARKRDERFSSALEFARALERASGALTWHPEQSGAFMQRIFQDRREETRSLVASIQDEEVTGATRIVELLGKVPRRGVPSRPPPLRLEPTEPPVASVQPSAPPVPDRENTEPGRVVKVSPLTSLPRPKPGAPRPVSPPPVQETSELTGPPTSPERKLSLESLEPVSLEISLPESTDSGLQPGPPLPDPYAAVEASDDAQADDEDDSRTIPASDLEALLRGTGLSQAELHERAVKLGAVPPTREPLRTSGHVGPVKAARKEEPEPSYTVTDTEPGSKHPLRRAKHHRLWTLLGWGALFTTLAFLAGWYLHVPRTPRPPEPKPTKAPAVAAPPQVLSPQKPPPKEPSVEASRPAPVPVPAAEVPPSPPPPAPSPSPEPEPRPKRSSNATPLKVSPPSSPAKTRASAADTAWEKAGNPPSAQGPGRLNLVTHPKATVVLKAQRLGITPLSEVPLQSGTHTLRLIDDEGTVRLLQVIITAGESTRVDVSLDTLLEEKP